MWSLTAEDANPLRGFTVLLRRRQELKHTWPIKSKAVQKMVQIGDNARCPECHEIGRVVWVSQDGKLAGIQCPRPHSQIVRGASILGSKARHQSKPERNMVFLMEIEIASTVSAKR